MTLNDNLDGTLSMLGQRDDDARYQSVRGCGRKDALVVRQGPLSSVDERQATIDTSEAKKRSSYSTPKSRVETPVATVAAPPPSSQPKAHYLTPATNARPAQNLQGGALEIWNSMRPHLTQFTECPDSGWIPELLKLPKLRDIVWNSDYIADNGFTDKVSRDVATMVMQVTGEIPPKTCSRCRDGNKGPYGECIVMSSQAPLDARLAFASCASCIYSGQGTYCTLKFWGKKRAQDAAVEMGGQGATHQPLADGAQLDTTSVPGSQVQPSTEDQSHFRRSERVQVKEAMAQSAPDNPPASTREASPDPTYMPYEEEAAPAVPPSPPRRILRTLPHRSEEELQRQPEPGSRPTNTDSMEIEDWELAPGRLRSAAPRRDDDVGPVDNIAYSRNYLAANQSVRVSQDAAFRVEIVSSGTTLRLTGVPDRLRICSVGAGKVRVRMQDEGEFDLGPHGMFRVLPGNSCVVLNRLYGDAVLHVTEVSDYN